MFANIFRTDTHDSTIYYRNITKLVHLNVKT